MSVEWVQRGHGRVARVRWRDESGREHSKVIGSRRDALVFDAEIRRRKRLGELAQMDDGKQALDAFAERWWTEHAVDLAESTRRCYAAMYDKHLLPRLGTLTLREVTPVTVMELKRELQCQGVGLAAISKALVVGQSIFGHAVRCGHVKQNPFAAVPKPTRKRVRTVNCLPPVKVEAIRDELLQRRRMRDATIISLLAYAGLRPQELQALRWRHVRERTILVEQATSVTGELKTTKNARSRTVRLLAPLASDLSEWRIANGRPTDDELLFPSRHGQSWGKEDWSNWRNRIFSPAAAAANVRISRPYDLRHAFVSLLLHEGVNPVEIARQAGHSLQTMWSTYAHTVEELVDGPRQAADDVIRAARARPHARGGVVPAESSVLAIFEATRHAAGQSSNT
jgi:integrase